MALGKTPMLNQDSSTQSSNTVTLNNTQKSFCNGHCNAQERFSNAHESFCNAQKKFSNARQKSNPELLQYYTVDCEKCSNKIASASIHKAHQIIATDLYDFAKYESDRKFLGKIANQRGNLTPWESERFSQLCNELGGAV